LGRSTSAPPNSRKTPFQYQTQLATIGNALSDTGDLLLYGCNVAPGIQWQAFITALASVTGADVAASTDFIGLAISTIYNGGSSELFHQRYH